MIPDEHRTATASTVARRHRFLPPATLVGLLAAALVIIAFGAFSYRSLTESSAAGEQFHRTQEALEALQIVLTDLKDAESGQRGYVLTGKDSYLDPYRNGRNVFPRDVAELRRLVADNPTQRTRLEQIVALSHDKFDELQETIDLRRADNLAAAIAVVQTDRGKQAMDRMRGLIAQMQATETGQFSTREAAWQEAVRYSFLVTVVGATLLLGFVGLATWLLASAHRERETEVWLRAGQSGFSAQLLGLRDLTALGDKAVSFLSRYLDAAVATLFVADDAGKLRYLAGYGDGVAQPESVAAEARHEHHVGAGLLAQAAKDARPIRLRDLPDGYLPIRSSVGRGQPRELLLVPAIADGAVLGVMEFGFLRTIEKVDEELLARVAGPIAVAVRSSREAARIDNLLAETQRQSEELQAQQEELRVSNEELEEQGRALKASQVQLEGQQAELEQTNSQLEEQAQILESHRDELSRSQTFLEDKARELERSNQYKSEFLANMSHELRTPLNSTLILAKLLADNKAGNLDAEQVRYAETISSAGNDLLTLINDILDLSKIEAGKVDVTIEPVVVGRLVESVAQSFEQVAKQNGLAFDVVIAAGSPATIETDPQRTAQILRNLLSNALKFTGRGGVTLNVALVGADAIAFSVTDTGIGIPPHQQQIIFEAFRQADGSTHRRYGGTGLGLSISRDLARLLGGDLTVDSAEGRGSTFTLTLPRVGRVTAPTPTAQAPAQASLPAARPLPQPPRVDPNAAPGLPPSDSDDRDHLAPGARAILVIEDDVRFAAILQELAHELGFQCIVTHTAGDGLAAAKQYLPSAILLDMHLPDHSGLGVLDQLKQNPATRHIPVHIASVADHEQEARALGAVGYDLKPVNREQVVEALRKLGMRLAQQLRRVLVVEDDARQLDSIRQLLQSEDVEIVGVSTAAEALECLVSTTFDCMVMDLNLPDLSGYELLEKMSEQEDVPFPPVIVYTGRVLGRDEEQRLRRYSKSIIIKDARSPERLLDEVTLFLHQIESKLPPDRQRMLREVRSRDATLEGRRILIVEDDVRNVFALSSVLEPKGAKIEIARNGYEALDALARGATDPAKAIDLVLMDIMMPEMDGYTAMREIRKRPEWKRLPIIALTAKAMRDDQEKCLAAGANDYVAKPLDVEKLMSLIRVWMPK
jgi:CheY-like chemotaxis protein